MEDGARQRIVVGVDGSPGANRAVAWALEEAALRHADIRLLYALASRPTEYPEEGVDLLASALEDAGGAPPGVAVERAARFGAPAGQLVEESAEAALVVVGSRGRGGFAGLVLGSVSQQVVQHASCPVVVVPAAERSTPAA